MPRIPRTLQKTYDKNRDGVIDSDAVSVEGAKGDKGDPGQDGVSVVGATSDGTNITFELSDGSTFDVPWPAQ